MWIRSQNKCVLVKSDCFSLETEYDVFNDCSITEIFANRKPVGTYSTIEKALLVLDMIKKYQCIKATLYFKCHKMRMWKYGKKTNS